MTTSGMVKFTLLHFYDCHAECGDSKRDMRALWSQMYADYYAVYRELTASMGITESMRKLEL